MAMYSTPTMCQALCWLWIKSHDNFELLSLCFRFKKKVKGLELNNVPQITQKTKVCPISKTRLFPMLLLHIFSVRF